MVPPDRHRLPRHLSPALEFVLISVWTAVLFGPLLAGGYLADDFFLIGRASTLRGTPDWGWVPQLWHAPAAGEGPAIVRPVWRASYLLDVLFVSSGVGAAASRAVGFLLHAVVAWLSIRWLHALGARPSTARLVGFLAVPWPTGVEAVVWIAARCDLLATAGMLAALVLRAGALARPERRTAARELGVWSMLVVALWSKETAAAGGALLLAQEFWHPARVGRPARECLAASRGFLLRGACLAAALVAHRWAVLGGPVGGYESEGLGFDEFLISVGRNLCSTAFPLWGLTDLPLSAANTRRVLLLTLLGLGILAARRRSGAVVRLASLWLVASLAVVGGLRVDEPLGPHTRLLYQPSLAWLALVCAGLARLTVVGAPEAVSPLRRNLAQAGGVVLGVAALALHRPGTADHAAAAAESGRLVRALAAEFERAAELAPEDRGALMVTGVPAFHGRAPLGLNAFPALLGPPFLPVVLGLRAAGVTPEAWAEEPVGPRQARVLTEPDRRLLAWDGRELEPVDALAYDGPRAPLLPLVLEGGARDRRLRLSGAEPGAVVRLLLGRPGEGVELGVVGRTGLVPRRSLPVGRTDSDGSLVLTPADVPALRNPAGPVGVQALVLGSRTVALSELRTLAPSRR